MKRITIAILMILTIQLQAVTMIVRKGETSTTAINPSAAGDDVIVEEGGTLEPPSGSTAITLDDNDQAALNQGTISTTGDDANGIFNNGANAVITNQGSISTTGDGAIGIYNNFGANAVITNSGSISTRGGDAVGIENRGDNAVLTNSGSISTTGDDDAVGIENFGANAVITNSGTISTTGRDAIGIWNSNGANAVITNSGSISTTGVNAEGIFNSGNNVHIINSGTIYSAQSHALFIDGSGNTLSLLRGSNLQGTVQIDDNNCTLNVERGLNLALTRTSGSQNFATLGISAPYVQVGQTIAVIDPTGLALQADVAADLSDSILDGIYHHRLGCCTPFSCGLWAQGIGSYRKRGHDSDIVGYDSWQGGGLLGYDTYFCGGNISVFGGAAYTRPEVDENTQRANINSYVGGLSYERTFCDNFFGVAFAAGYLDWDNERFVMNNQVAGGVESGRADIDGWFVSPEVTLSRQFLCLRCHPILSFTARYAGLFLGDYHEKGSQTNLSVKDRDIDLLTTRFEAAVPYSSDSQGRCCWSVEPYAGVFGRYQLGGYRVDGELLGQSLSFDQGGPRNLAAFLIGFRGIQSFGRLNLSLNLEASFDTENSSRILGEADLAWSF